MPEGDAVWRTAKALREALQDRPLAGVDLRWPGVAGEGLRGRVTLDVVPRGKHLLHRIEGGVTIHSHLRMDGSWRTMPLRAVTPRVAADRDIRAIVASPERAAIGTLLGMLDVLPTAEEHRLVGHLGPDVLGPDWDEDRAVDNLLRQPDREIGAALLDQRNLAGLGTIWVSEPLFMVRLDPWSRVGDVGRAGLLRVVRQAHDMIRAGIVGDWRDYDPLVLGRVGKPCRRCRKPLVRGTIATPPQDRVMTWCPNCQRKPAITPTD